MTAYDPDNIIAKIIAGKLPAYTVYEDADTLAFLDLFPQAPGHTLVIPRAPARNILDADPVVFQPLMETVQKVSRAAMQVFLCNGIRIMQFNEAPAGQTIFHLHVHVIPVTAIVTNHGQTAKGDPEILRAQADALKHALAHM